ncbi:MAG: DUF4249 family protein [Paludibacter sp.]
MKFKPIFILAILYFTLSCSSGLEPVEIDLSDGFKPQITVSSFLNPDSVVNILLAPTQAAYSIKISALPQITSSIIKNLTTNTTYHLINNAVKNNIFLTTSEFIPLKGSIYSIKIETNNPLQTIEATDTLPSNEVKITDVKIDPIRKTTSYLGKVIFIPLNEKQTKYYELVLFVQDMSAIIKPQPFYQISLKSKDQLITREDYYPNLLLLGAEDPCSLLFRLNSQNEEISLNFEYGSGEGQSGSSINTWDQNIKVQIRSVSYSYFQYKTSLYKQIYAAEGDLLYGMASPVKVKGNIIGGLGILGSYCKVDSTVFVAGRTHIENE